MTETGTSIAQSFDVRVDDLYLDPNNYRFIDHADYTVVSGEAKLFDVDVQRRTEIFILGKNQENVRDLIDSLKKNGWVPVDQIQVRASETRPGKYLVVEGNRRVATLRYLAQRYREAKIDLGELKPAVFDAVPVNAYSDKDPSHYRVLMGLKHISGNKRWPALNQAKLLKTLQDVDGMSADDICHAVGIRKQEFNVAMRTLALCETYQASDFGEQFRTDQYNLFQEIVKSAAVKKWLGWNEAQWSAENRENLDRLFSLISSDESLRDEDGENRPTDPAITTSAQIRELAKLIEDPEALKNLERTRSLAEATISSEILVKNRVERSIGIIDQEVKLLFNHAHSLNEDDMEEVQRVAESLRGVITARNGQPDLLGTSAERIPFNSIIKSHFASVTVDRYRRLRGVAFDGLRRINLFAGVNNSGKTSVLEAIYLLSQQNNADAVLEIVVRRGKIVGNPSPLWVVEEIPAPAAIRGIFDDVPDRLASVELTTVAEASSVENKAGYLATIRLDAAYGGQTQSSETHLFGHRERRTSFSRSRILCPAVLSSPFSAHNFETILQHHEKTVEAKAMDPIVKFLKEKVDDGVQGIYLTDSAGTRRFRVNHRDFKTAVDLTRFGEGFQRTFFVALAFAFAANGVVLIDELENAVHASLLVDFARLIEDLANRFNLQVFITTHSKECVDAFIKGGCHVENIAGYGLGLEDGAVLVRRVAGETLRELIDAFDADLRVVR